MEYEEAYYYFTVFLGRETLHLARWSSFDGCGGGWEHFFEKKKLDNDGLPQDLNKTKTKEITEVKQDG